MNNIAIIGASYLQLPLIKKAKELGYVTHVFAWKVNDVGEKEADFFYPISIVDIDKIADKCNEIGICGICSIASDLANVTVNCVGNKLNLICNSLECNKITTNKYLMRKRFFERGDPSPLSYLVDSNTNLSLLNLNFPVIVKPTDRSGSRGVRLVNKVQDLCFAVKSALNESFEKKVVVEEYADGQEYSVEAISFNGNHKILAITLKYTTGAPYFIETGHLEPAPLFNETRSKIIEVVTHALDSLYVKYGASHSEIKIDSRGNIKIIEIGSRMGGDCIGSDLVRYTTGIDYLRAVIEIATGLPPDLTPNKKINKAEVRFILNKKDVDEFEALKKNYPEKILRVAKEPDISLLEKTTDSSNRAGCYIVNAS